MPIVNGKYSNPNWVNDAPPAIDAEELNAIGETLENLESETVKIANDVDEVRNQTAFAFPTYFLLMANANTRANVSAFVPSKVDEFIDKRINVGYGIAKYLEQAVTDKTYSKIQIDRMKEQNTWYDFCRNRVTRNSIKASPTFLEKVKSVNFAKFVYENPQGTYAQVIEYCNSITNTHYQKISEFKQDPNALDAVLNSEIACRLIMWNAEIEDELFNGGNNLFITTSNAAFTVPAGVTTMGAIAISHGGVGNDQQGHIFSSYLETREDRTLTINMSSEYGNHTNIVDSVDGEIFSSEWGQKISDANCSLLGRATDGNNGSTYDRIEGSSIVYPNGRSGDGAGGAGFFAIAASAEGGAAVDHTNGNDGIGAGTIIPFSDDQINISSYMDETSRENTSILYKKVAELNLWGGAGGGGGNGGNSMFGGGTGGGGGGGWGAAGGKYGYGGGGNSAEILSGVCGAGGAGWGAGGSGGYGNSKKGGAAHSGGSGASGAAGGASESLNGDGKGAPGVVVLFW